MINKKLLIQNKLGLHARASAKLVDAAGRFGAEIYIKKDDAEVNAKSIMGIMMLAASQGTEVEFSFDGDDENEACEAITALLDDKFGEEE